MKERNPLGRMIKAGVLIAMVFTACTLPAQKHKAKPLGELPPTPERTARYEHAGFTVARASIHNHTTYSDGCHTAEDLLTLANSQGMSILAITDHHGGKMCYGTYFCGERGGAGGAGYDVYYDELRQVAEKAKDLNMILLKGVEVSSPYVRNHGRFPNLVLRGEVYHFVVYKIEDPEVFEEMPVRYNVPFKPELDYGDEPYIKFIKYMNDHGGLVTCAHPEWAPDSWNGPVHSLNVPPHENVLLPGLVAWAAIPESWQVVPRPGEWWDLVLAEYLIGMRDKPLWVEGDADYHCSGSLALGTTMFYLKDFTEPDVYAAMEEGRMVALMGEAFQDTFVSTWSVADGGPAESEVMLGREVVVDGAPVVRFALNRPVQGCRTILVRNGVKVLEVEGTEFEFKDTDQAAKRAPAFYRVEVIGPRANTKEWESPTMPQSELFVNPIFVRFKVK
jgi:hypothetical protein